MKTLSGSIMLGIGIAAGILSTLTVVTFATNGTTKPKNFHLHIKDHMPVKDRCAFEEALKKGETANTEKKMKWRVSENATDEVIPESTCTPTPTPTPGSKDGGIKSTDTPLAEQLKIERLTPIGIHTTTQINFESAAHLKTVVNLLAD